MSVAEIAPGPASESTLPDPPASWGRSVLLLLALYGLAALGFAATSALPPVVQLSGHAVPLHRLHDLFFRFSVIGLVVVPAIFLAELPLVGWRHSSIGALVGARTPAMRSDTVCFLLNHLRLSRWLQLAMTFGLTLLSGMALHDLILRETGIRLSWDWLPVVPRIALFYLLYTCLDYWAHRIDHTRLMWPLHRFHHAAEDFVVLTAARGHPAAAFSQIAIKTFPLAGLGLTATNLIDLTMIEVVLNYVIHSRIPLRFGWVGRWLVQSPTHHRLHHLKLYDGRTWNYSLCPLWDRLFGTWRDAPAEPVTIGIEYPYRHGAWVLPDMLRDYGEFLRGWIGLMR
jgi:sterol desaturase/sphingolipid hydroxylase (fatty acid hydroxylase superfamily)